MAIISKIICCLIVVLLLLHGLISTATCIVIGYVFACILDLYLDRKSRKDSGEKKAFIVCCNDCIKTVVINDRRKANAVLEKMRGANIKARNSMSKEDHNRRFYWRIYEVSISS